ncbi:MAG TPA: tetratricopeptide repeat protein, partial [Candidatus Kapabacteria bacterium]|nr:tetratricopeptide repeat protein [Candidatus Kapabacteria bacterium]
MHTESHHSEEDEQRLVEALTLAFETMKTSLNKALTLCDEIYESLVYYTLSDKKREYYTARTLLLRASIHAEFRHYEKGLEDVEIAFNTFLTLHDNEYCARSLLVKAIALTYNAQFSEALNVLNEATFYAHQTTNAEIRAAIPLRMGFVQHTMGNHDKALEYYYQTLHGLDEKQFPLLAATCYNDIAAALTRIEHFSEAEEYYKKAIAINKSNNNKRGLIRNLSDYGVLLTQRGH